MLYSKISLVIGSLCLVLMAPGCGGPGPKTADQADAPVSPEQAFRASFHNPGGMWLPAQMELPEHQEIFGQMGVSLTAGQLSDPLGAPLASIVSLGNCTASFVSPDGLLVTNHHCVQHALQHNSNEKQDLVADGFLAGSRGEELNAGPAQRVFVARSFQDVTDEMRSGLDAIADPLARKQESERRYKEIIARCEKDKPGVRCHLKSFFRDSQYTLIEYLEIRDVRLVYVPKRSVGNYGGEIDNWQWPRHTGDFSFYRAYVGPDGLPADYAEENVPFQPSHYLKVSTEGLGPDDFVMVVGYPGRTNRTATAATVDFDVSWRYPTYIEYLQGSYDLAESFLSSEDKNTAIKAGVAKQYLQNALEYYQGALAGLTRGPLLEQKRQMDVRVKEWAAAPGREAFRADIENLETLEAESREDAPAEMMFRLAVRASAVLRTALDIVRFAEERPKADAHRKPGFQERDLPRHLASQKGFARSYDRALEQATLGHALKWALRLPAAERPWLTQLLGSGESQEIDASIIEKTLASWYANTQLEDEETRIVLISGATVKELEASSDPFIRAALAIWPAFTALEEKRDRRTGERILLSPAYVQGLREVLGGVLAPDANGTLRITYGTVKDFPKSSMRHGRRPFTTGAEILEKDKGVSPFDAPSALLEGIRDANFGPYAEPRLNGELPVNFLSDLDITGGNSGSSTLNHKGELVGLVFDGTREGLASDVVFDSETTRAIHVDVRYILWIMDAIDGADALLEEMGIVPAL